MIRTVIQNRMFKSMYNLIIIIPLFFNYFLSIFSWKHIQCEINYHSNINMITQEIKLRRKVFHINKLIIGGGISGIFLGRQLKDKGDRNFLILEKDNHAMGLCRSFKMGNLYYDVGAHALHREAIVASRILSKYINTDNIYCQKRKAKVFAFNKLVSHPLQLHLYYLPFILKIRCLVGYFLRSRNEINNFYDWLLAMFGKSLCTLFLFPYNEKIWDTNLKNISTNWVNRVPSGTFRVLKGFMFGGDKNYSSNEYVCYPTTGGFAGLFTDIVEGLKDNIKLNSEVTNIDLQNKTVITRDGFTFEYNQLISTLPVDVFLLKLAVVKKQAILNSIKQLKKTSMCLVTFLTKKHFTDNQRVYIPDKRYFANRIVINSNSNHYMKSQNESIFSLEISYSNKESLPSNNEILTNCKILLKELGFIQKDEDVKEIKFDFVDYAYPIQTLYSASIIDSVNSFLSDYQCFSIGRFGSWNYSNIDGILKEVINLTEKTLHL